MNSNRSGFTWTLTPSPSHAMQQVLVASRALSGRTRSATSTLRSSSTAANVAAERSRGFSFGSVSSIRSEHAGSGGAHIARSCVRVGLSSRRELFERRSLYRWMLQSWLPATRLRCSGTLEAGVTGGSASCVRAVAIAPTTRARASTSTPASCEGRGVGAGNGGKSKACASLLDLAFDLRLRWPRCTACRMVAAAC